MSYYGTKMSQLYTAHEGFTTTQTGYPVRVHIVTGSVVVNGKEIKIDPTNVQSIKQLESRIQDIETTVKNDTGKDIRVRFRSRQLSDSKKNDYTSITRRTIDGTDYRNFIVGTDNDEPVYHIYILPILVGDNINNYILSAPKNAPVIRDDLKSNRDDKNFYVGIKTNTGGDRGVDTQESIFEYIFNSITAWEELEFTEPFVDTTTNTNTNTNTNL